MEHPLPRRSTCSRRKTRSSREGTYPLPEAQLDRFFLSIEIGYPDLAAERAMLLATTAAGRGGPPRSWTRMA
ncbi:MAG: hypothetical protein WDN04_07120 [Rhodospirillales bacterium]